MIEKPKVKSQGLCVVQKDISGYLVMLPSGDVLLEHSKKKAEKRCKTWFADNMPKDAIGVGRIEWRGKENGQV